MISCSSFARFNYSQALSSNYNRKTKTSEMWLTTLDQQTYTPIARALISDPMGPDPKNIRHRDNRSLHSDDNRYLARIAGLADKNSTEHQIVIMNDNLEVVKRESLRSSSNQTRIISARLTDTGDLLLLMRTGAESETGTKASPSTPWDVVVLGPDHATPIRSTLDFDGHLVDNVTFSHIRGGSVVIAGVQNWAATPTAFCGELDLKAIAQGQSRITNWRQSHKTPGKDATAATELSEEQKQNRRLQKEL